MDFIVQTIQKVKRMQTVQYKRKVVDAKHILLFMTDILLTSITINTFTHIHIHTKGSYTYFDNIHLRQMLLFCV